MNEDKRLQVFKNVNQLKTQEKKLKSLEYDISIGLLKRILLH
jgi:hypothetical protein